MEEKQRSRRRIVAAASIRRYIYRLMPASTPFFPPWRAVLAGFHRGRDTVRRHLAHATLSHIEQRFAPALPAALLPQTASHDHSRERIFTLTRTVWCWIWQALQSHASCREAVCQVQALFALHDAGQVDKATGAYCEARRKVPEAVLQKLFATSFQRAEQA